jgi:hypothetical protein
LNGWERERVLNTIRGGNKTKNKKVGDWFKIKRNKRCNGERGIS